MTVTNPIHEFFTAHEAYFGRDGVFSVDTPHKMMASGVDKEGWFKWTLVKGILSENDYHKVENTYKIKFPKSFIQWHKEYFFLDGDCSLIRLPASNPNAPLAELKDNLKWRYSKQLISNKLFPFAQEGNDNGTIVFDGRNDIEGDEFPIRVYNHQYRGDLEGLSEIIFSSFSKLLVCMTHFMKNLQSRKDFEIIPDFFEIDMLGAGDTGRNYWIGWRDMLKSNDEFFGED